MSEYSSTLVLYSFENKVSLLNSLIVGFSVYSKIKIKKI